MLRFRRFDDDDGRIVRSVAAGLGTAPFELRRPLGSPSSWLILSQCSLYTTPVVICSWIARASREEQKHGELGAPAPDRLGG